MFDLETEHSDLDVDGKRVDVYKNLNDDCFSIMSRETDRDEYGTVIGHADLVLLTDVEFVVQEAGQQRVRESEVKNVHAMVRGRVVGVDMDGEMEWNMMVRLFANDALNVGYDPYETDHFEVQKVVNQEKHDYSVGDPIHEAVYACVSENGVGVLLPNDG